MFLLYTLLLASVLCACDSKAGEKPVSKSGISKSLCVSRAIDAFAPIEEGTMRLFEGLGNQTFSITTGSELAQAYFLQGFKLANGFNHMEATRSFRYALMQDSTCAMCYWGLAFVLGPNINMGFDGEVLDFAREALRKAEMYMPQATPKEQALIKAMIKRFPSSPDEEQLPYEEAYALEMRQVARRYADDNDIQALLAEALMNLHPWKLWESDGRAKAWTPEILQILEGILARDPDHIAAIHLYIHATEEASPLVVNNFSPHRAMEHAARLPLLAPGAAHLVHMPSHTYIRTGDYHLGKLANQAAAAVDSQYLAACHAAGVYPLVYYPHNFHFLAACAALGGDSKNAIEASWRMVEKLDTLIMREPGYETIQHYYSIPYYVLVKFARWNDILQLPRPARDLGYPTAIWRYARGMAFAAQGQLKQAQEELAGLRLLQKDENIRAFTIWDINEVGDLLDIAVFVLSGEIAFREGDINKAVRALESAIVIEDGLAYNEPPDWFFSVRHHLGPVLLAAGRNEEAEQLYRRDLELFPKNGYAYNGLIEALRAQGKMEELPALQARFEEAWKHADVTLKASLAGS
jgi:tetratricopeptide (TPR) repeat protein